MNQPKYKLFNLTSITRSIGSVSLDAIDDVQGRCNCGAWLNQDVDRCKECGLPIIWENSVVWEKMYGNPRTARAEYEGYDNGCTTSTELIAAAGSRGFPTKQGAAVWCEYELLCGEETARRDIFFITKTREERGNNAMYHAIAIAKRKVAEAKDKLRLRTNKKLSTISKAVDTDPENESKWN